MLCSQLVEKNLKTTESIMCASLVAVHSGVPHSYTCDLVNLVCLVRDQMSSIVTVGGCIAGFNLCLKRSVVIVLNFTA